MYAQDFNYAVIKARYTVTHVPLGKQRSGYVNSSIWPHNHAWERAEFDKDVAEDAFASCLKCRFVYENVFEYLHFFQ